MSSGGVPSVRDSGGDGNPFSLRFLADGTLVIEEREPGARAPGDGSLVSLDEETGRLTLVPESDRAA